MAQSAVAVKYTNSNFAERKGHSKIVVDMLEFHLVIK